MKAETPSQRPQRWTFGLTGHLILAACPAKQAVPRHVVELMDHRLTELRVLAVEQLAPLLKDEKPLLQRAAWKLWSA